MAKGKAQGAFRRRPPGCLREVSHNTSAFASNQNTLKFKDTPKFCQRGKVFKLVSPSDVRTTLQHHFHGRPRRRSCVRCRSVGRQALLCRPALLQPSASCTQLRRHAALVNRTVRVQDRRLYQTALPKSHQASLSSVVVSEHLFRTPQRSAIARADRLQIARAWRGILPARAYLVRARIPRATVCKVASQPGPGSNRLQVAYNRVPQSQLTAQSCTRLATLLGRGLTPSGQPHHAFLVCASVSEVRLLAPDHLQIVLGAC